MTISPHDDRIQTSTNNLTSNAMIISISRPTNADKPRDAALRKIDIIVHTEYNYQAMSIGR